MGIPILEKIVFILKQPRTGLSDYWSAPVPIVAVDSIDKNIESNYARSFLGTTLSMTLIVAILHHSLCVHTDQISDTFLFILQIWS